MNDTIIEHLESHLGMIERGWGEPELQVAKFVGTPDAGVSTFCTIGLSRTPLPMRDGRLVRQELLVSVAASYQDDAVASFLLTFSEYVLSKNRALLRGDVVGPAQPLIPGVSASAVYCAMPVFFPDEFVTYRGSDPSTVLVWLVPQPPAEAEFSRRVGWDRYETTLEEEGVVASSGIPRPARGRIDLASISRSRIRILCCIGLDGRGLEVWKSGG